MTLVTLIFSAGLLAGTETHNLCIIDPNTSGQRLSCCIDSNGEQCCSGSETSSGVPVGCDCQPNG